MKIPFVRSLANQGFKKTRAFEPPVSKKFGIEGNDHNGIKTRRGDLADLLPAFVDKLKGLHFGDSFRGDWIV